jgi:signal transduction histidine kinase
MREGHEPRLSRGLLASVRLRVTAAATLAVVAVLVVAGIALVQAQGRQLLDRVDETVAQRADELAAEIRAGNSNPALTARGADTVSQVVGSDGRVLAASPALSGKPALVTGPRQPGPRTVHDVPLETGEYRLVARVISTPDGPVTLLVAGSLDDVAESTDAVRRSLLVGIPVVAAILAVFVWILVGRLLRRVELANAAQQRFVADASHELRTPLARMRTELEVDLAHPGTSDATATRRSLLEETVELQHLTDDLLLLARSDAGGWSGSHVLVDLDAVVLTECRAATVPEGIGLDTSGVAPTQTRGDAGQLARAFRNGLENALRHASSAVAVTVGQADGSARVTVTDDGPGIPVADRRRVFDRFIRLDDARSTTAGGSGLGLAITREIVEHHGGRVWVEAAPGGGTVLSVTLASGR